MRRRKALAFFQAGRDSIQAAIGGRQSVSSFVGGEFERARGKKAITRTVMRVYEKKTPLELAHVQKTVFLLRA